MPAFAQMSHSIIILNNNFSFCSTHNEISTHRCACLAGKIFLKRRECRNTSAYPKIIQITYTNYACTIVQVGVFWSERYRGSYFNGPPVNLLINHYPEHPNFVASKFRVSTTLDSVLVNDAPDELESNRRSIIILTEQTLISNVCK
jgi:hypothetical protein